MSDERDGQAGQEDVPVDPPEGHFAEMVEAGFAEQFHRSDRGEREGAGDRFLVVVEIEEEGLAVAGLDEAVGVSVETAAQRLAGDEMEDVFGQDLGLEVGDGAGFGGRAIGGVADDEDVGVGFRLQGVLVGRDAVEFVAEAGALDHFRAHVGRHGDQQVVGDFLLVPRDDGFFLRIDPGDGEVVDDGNAFFLEQFAQDAGGDGLGEGAGHRGHVGDLCFVAQSLLFQPRVGEEAELERGHGAFDRHLTDVDDEFAAWPGLQALGEGFRTFKGVELVDVFAPVAVDHSFHLIGGGVDAGGDDEDVVGNFAAVLQVDAVGFRVDAVDVRFAVIDPAWNGALHRTTHVVRGINPEGHEEVSGLVVVVCRAVDEGDGPVGLRQFPAKVAGHNGASRAGAENEEILHECPLGFGPPHARSQRPKMRGSLIV